VEYAADALALTEAPESVHALLKQRFRWCFGVLQTVWKHKRAIILPPKKNPVIGVVLLPAVLLSHIATPLLAPIADIAAIIAIALGYGSTVLPYALVLLWAELILTVTALTIDRGSAKLMWDWPVNRMVYRWILFVALSRAAGAALRGTAVGWGKLVRTGTVQLSQTRATREA
jgi:peptidoglycan-N-acetylglucosamine deacetylase